MIGSVVPQGPIYQELRAMVLSSIVAGSKATLKNSMSLSDWFTNGTYSVVRATKNTYTLHVSSVDFGSSLLTDIEHLSNHCFEHVQEIMCYHLDIRPRSDAWNVVTLYYFAFFCAQLLLRLLGIPVVYLKREITSALMQNGGFKGPGPGAFTLVKTKDISLTISEYDLKQSNSSKVHDATWRRLFSLFEDLLKNPQLTTNASEVQLFSLLTTKSLFASYNADFAWPSEIRNKSNYRVGFAYVKVDDDDITRAKKLMGQWRFLEKWSDVEGLLTSGIAGCAAGKNSEFSSHVRLLHELAQCLFLVTHELYADLLLRSGIDKRWEHNRARFRKKMVFPENEYPLIAKAVGNR